MSCRQLQNSSRFRDDDREPHASALLEVLEREVPDVDLAAHRPVHAERDLFDFQGCNCDAMVARVLARLEARDRLP